MKPTSWLSFVKRRSSSVSSASARRASSRKNASFEAAYSCHMMPGQKPPVHQLLPSKGEASQRPPSPR